MSTVKIRARSLFRIPLAPVPPSGADFAALAFRFPLPSTDDPFPAQDVHSPSPIAACANAASGCKFE